MSRRCKQATGIMRCFRRMRTYDNDVVAYCRSYKMVLYRHVISYLWWLLWRSCGCIMFVVTVSSRFSSRTHIARESIPNVIAHLLFIIYQIFLVRLYLIFLGKLCVWKIIHSVDIPAFITLYTIANFILERIKHQGFPRFASVRSNVLARERVNLKFSTELAICNDWERKYGKSWDRGRSMSPSVFERLPFLRLMSER